MSIVIKYTAGVVEQFFCLRHLLLVKGGLEINKVSHVKSSRLLALSSYGIWL